MQSHAQIGLPRKFTEVHFDIYKVVTTHKTTPIQMEGTRKYESHTHFTSVVLRLQGMVHDHYFHLFNFQA